MFDTLKLLAESLVFKRVIIIYCAYIVTPMLDTKYVNDKFQIHRGLHHFRHQHRLSNGSKKPPISIIGNRYHQHQCRRFSRKLSFCHQQKSPLKSVLN